jgi:hypothetical protein
MLRGGCGPQVSGVRDVPERLLDHECCANDALVHLDQILSRPLSRRV